DDVVIYDGEGYPALRDFLKKQGVRHVLLAGYNTDMCVCSTTAGYKNLSQDFDVFLVGDATIATFPAHPTPRFPTTSTVCFAPLSGFIAEVSWVRLVPAGVGGGRGDEDDALAGGFRPVATRLPGRRNRHGPGDGRAGSSFHGPVSREERPDRH